LDEKVYFVALNMMTGIGPGKKRELLEYFKSAVNIFTVESSELKSVIRGKAESEVVDKRGVLLEQAEKELDKANLLNVGITHIHANDYPGNLLSIPDPPIVLYYKGDLSNNNINSIAVVGCRNATPYGLNNSYRLGQGLAEKGVTVVSGLAKGIDGEAHKGCLDAGGNTIAVLGCGIDKIFPKEHTKLHYQIAKEGCLLSEFPIGKEPRGFHFPMRNRIICGLSVGVVVVEGSQDSGSLYTANYALDYGRELYAFPGPAQNYNYSGTHLLIKKGAKLIENTKDLLDDLSLVLDFELLSKTKEKKSYKNIPQQNEILLDTNKKDFFLTDDEKIIFNCLSPVKSKYFDNIVEDSGLRVEKVMSILTSLVLKDLCIQTDGNHYLQSP